LGGIGSRKESKSEAFRGGEGGKKKEHYYEIGERKKVRGGGGNQKKEGNNFVFGNRGGRGKSLKKREKKKRKIKGCRRGITIQIPLAGEEERKIQHHVPIEGRGKDPHSEWRVEREGRQRGSCESGEMASSPS